MIERYHSLLLVFHLEIIGRSAVKVSALTQALNEKASSSVASPKESKALSATFKIASEPSKSIEAEANSPVDL